MSSEKAVAGVSVADFLTISESFPGLPSTGIRVGVLDHWGPWQPADADGTIVSRVETPRPVANLYRSISSLNVMGKSAPKIGLNRKHASQPMARFADYEVIAVDALGVRHPRRGAAIWNHDQVPYFDLRDIDLESFEFRLRPYVQWAEFKNVPLKPGEPAAEVSVTEPQSANDEQ